MNSCAPFSSSSILPLSLPLSSALAQDRINIPLKPVSTAARSPSPPPSLLLCLFLPPPSIPPHHPLFFFLPPPPRLPDSFSGATVSSKGISFPTISTHQSGWEGHSQYLQSGVPPVAHMHTHMHGGVVGTDAFDRAC